MVQLIWFCPTVRSRLKSSTRKLNKSTLKLMIMTNNIWLNKVLPNNKTLPKPLNKPQKPKKTQLRSLKKKPNPQLNNLNNQKKYKKSNHNQPPHKNPHKNQRKVRKRQSSKPEQSQRPENKNATHSSLSSFNTTKAQSITLWLGTTVRFCPCCLPKSQQTYFIIVNLVFEFLL